MTQPAALRLLQRFLIAVARAYVTLWHRGRAWAPSGRRLPRPASLLGEAADGCRRLPVPAIGPRGTLPTRRFETQATGIILVANHRSPIDPLALQSSVREPIGFLLAREFFDVRPWTWLYRAMACIPVERGRRDITATKRALEHLASGKALGVFPEGRLNADPKRLLPFQPGAALLALRERVPVVPAFVKGSPRGKTLVGSFFRRGRIEVRFGPPICLDGYRGRRRDATTIEEVTKLLERAVAKLGGVLPPTKRLES